MTITSSADGSYVEALYQSYQKNPDSIEESWKQFFEGFEFALDQPLSSSGGGELSQEALQRELKAYQLIEGYRYRGHLLSTTNPIRERKNRYAYLSIEDYGLAERDLDQPLMVSQELGFDQATLQEVIDHLQKVYTGNIGIEFKHIRRVDIGNWVQQRFEDTFPTYQFSVNEKKQILQKLNQASVFENFLHTKYIGQKRFSLEGGENTIPALDTMINDGADQGVQEVVLGMAHRGRLNVLANILGKTYDYIFNEFEGEVEPNLQMGDGDVKYHLGFSSKVQTRNGQDVFVQLAPNPSHLEAVDPVVEGYARAKGDVLFNEDRNNILPVLLHGDAALAGQGVVYETIQMAQLEGYHTGGTIHFVINNQLGFTTDFDQGRSSDYSTAVGEILDTPVLHVNGDDAEAVVYATKLAVEFRQKFNHDIIIDMVCYRKHGHNEGDDPKITHPTLYNTIANHAGPREIYSEQLIEEGEIEAQMAKDLKKDFKQMLQDRLNMVREQPLEYEYQQPDQEWRKLRNSTPEDFKESPDTSVDKQSLEKVANALTAIPEDFTPIKQIKKELEKRQRAWDQGTFDWAMGELSAYGTLLQEGVDVRLSGQDTIRGTFAHRHSILYDANNDTPYHSLNHMEGANARLRVYNSLLSENAALGFEYGYALAYPYTLTIWEAQFGDFNNGAQTVIDQFISSGESKWQKMNGLVLYLPHGYEGQGPEHSSARLERFLQLSAEQNMVVGNFTTPANFFHAIRRQLTWDFRKPLVVMTPKSLLRHPQCVSDLSAFTDDKFREVIDDEGFRQKPEKARKVLLCSGKIYYELAAERAANSIEDIAIVRIEQLHPMPEYQLQQIYDRYTNASFYWVQEEPKNKGAWTYLLRWEENIKRLSLISRKASASPATGFSSIHKREQQDIITKALDLNPSE